MTAKTSDTDPLKIQSVDVLGTCGIIGMTLSNLVVLIPSSWHYFVPTIAISLGSLGISGVSSPPDMPRNRKSDRVSKSERNRIEG